MPRYTRRNERETEVMMNLLMWFPELQFVVIHQDLLDHPEMRVQCRDAQAVLHGAGGDPNVIGGNGFSRADHPHSGASARRFGIPPGVHRGRSGLISSSSEIWKASLMARCFRAAIARVPDQSCATRLD